MAKVQKDQQYYDQIKEKFAVERDLRLGYRPQGTDQYTSDFRVLDKNMESIPMRVVQMLAKR